MNGKIKNLMCPVFLFILTSSLEEEVITRVGVEEANGSAKLERERENLQLKNVIKIINIIRK